MKFSQTQSGFSMVEVLVAISILLLATVGPMTIAARSLQYSQFSGEQNTAFFLAQEGIEAVFNIRAARGLRHVDRFGGPSPTASWGWVSNPAFSDCFAPDGCGIDMRDRTLHTNLISCDPIENCRLLYDASANRARFFHDLNQAYDSGGVPSEYTRVIQIENVNPETVKVTSTVTWQASGSQQSREVVLQTYMNDVYAIQ